MERRGTRTAFEVVFGGEGEFCGDDFEAAFFESGEDLADETAVDAVGLFGTWANLTRARREERDTLTMM